MRQLGSNVFVNTCPPEQVTTNGANSSFIVTSEGLALIDSPYLPTNAVKWRDEAAKHGQVRFVINTEHHRDHVTGDYFFPGIIITSQVSRKVFGETVGSPDDVRQRASEEDPEGAHLLRDWRLKLPNIAFEERLDLYLGEHVFHLMRLPGHTTGQVAVFVPGERVVFTGDNFTNGWQPSLRTCSPLEWVQSLKTIESLDFDYVVPGHGDVGRKQDIPVFRAFIEECIDRIKQAIKQGLGKDQAMDGITFETPSYPPTLHPGAEQQRANVARLYDMLSGPSP